MLTFILILFIVLSGIIIIACFVEWLGTHHSWTTRIPYHEFKIRYGLDPKKWTLNDGYAEFRQKSGSHYIRFSFFDYLRYEAFLYSLDHERSKAREAELRKELEKAFLESDNTEEDNPDA